MENDLLGGLGGLMKGLTGFMPQDDPAVKLMNAQNEVNDLKNQESELFIEIGRQAYEQNPDLWPQSDKLKLIQSNISSAQIKLDAAKVEQETKEQEEKAEKDACTCPSCGYENPDGVKFCQECGAKLGGAIMVHCTSCGAELAPGTHFCGECGAKQREV